MHKQVSDWTVNFGPNFPESPFLELKTRKAPPPFQKTSDLGWPKFTPEYPPISENFRFGMTKVYSGIPPSNFRKLQIWDDQSLLRNTPPQKNSENFRFGMTKVYSGIPPQFRKTSDLGWPKFTPEIPPPPNENCQRVSVRDFQNTESYYMWRLYPTRITTSLLCFANFRELRHPFFRSTEILHHSVRLHSSQFEVCISYIVSSLTPPNISSKLLNSLYGMIAEIYQYKNSTEHCSPLHYTYCS